MRLVGWHVEGFGLLHDFRVMDLPGGLTVVLGPNEAGKTALLAFIRGALFGYPDRRKKDRQYPPLRGGRHGGRLFVESQGSIWTIERFASPPHVSVTQPDGAPGTETELRRLLGGVDAELYRNVFAFSLSELQEFESLQVEGVRDRIFAAGVVGAGRSARAAIETLVDQRAEIGRRRGNCRISNLRDRVDELDELLGQARARAARHPDLRRATDEADEEQKRVGRGLVDARHEMARLDTLLSAWPDWDELMQAKAELEALAATPELAEDFGTRLESSLVTARTQRERHEEQQRMVLDLEQQLAALVPDERLAAVSADVKRLAARIGIVRARRERLGEIRIQCDSLRRRVEEEAPRLGPGWTSRSVREFDTSIPVAQEIADWGDRLRAAEQEVRDAEREAAQFESSAQALRDEASRRSEALKGQLALPDGEHLSNCDAAVRRTRSKLPELAALRAERAAEAQRVADAGRRLHDAQTAAAAKESELERRGTALQSAPALPGSEDLTRRERAVRELRIGLAELGIARSDLRAANQRALDAKQRAVEAELSASADEKEAERRSAALAEERPIPDADTLATRSRAARELRSRLLDLAVLRSDLRFAEMRLADRRREAERPTALQPSSHRRLLFVTAGVLCGVALALALVAQFVAAVVALGAAIVTGVLAMILPAAASTAGGAASVGTAEAQQDIDELLERIQKIERLARPLAAILEFTSLPDQVELETQADEVAAQIRAREDRDRTAAAVEELRAHAQRARDIAQGLRTAADDAQAEVDNVISQHLRDLEAGNRIPATSLGFAELPTVAALEEKVAELRDLTQKRGDRDREAAALHALELEAGSARDLAARVEQELSDMRTAESTLATRVRAAEESALALGVSLGFSVIPEPADLEAKAKEIDNAVRNRQERDRNATEIEDLRRRTDTAETSARKAEDKAAACHADRDALHEEWSEWKTEHRCPAPLRPETAQHFFASVERLRDSLAQLDRMDTESATIRTEIQEFSQTVRLLAAQTCIPDPPGSSLAEDVLEGIRERVETDMELRAEHARTSRNLETARNALVISKRAAMASANALASLLEEARADDEHECRARIAASRHRADLNKQVRDTEHRLRSRLGVGADANAVRTELASGDRQGWEARKQTCKGTLARLQPEYEEALRRHQTAVETLSSLERECDIAALAIEREGVVAEIRDALSEWRRLAIAQSLVQRTLRRYELERQPAVLNRAAASLSRITAGRYTRLATREDGIDLIAADGHRLDAAVLSRGTAEQLYLCLRLALAEEFGHLAVPLPLVMDDVLVNFDPERARLAAGVLLDATPDHQVLLFTCHPETVDLLIDLAPDVKVIEIDRQMAVVRSIETAPEVGLDGATLHAGSSRQTGALLGRDLAEAVLSSIRAAGRPLSRAEILASTGMLEAHWTAVIQELRGRGLVISHGRKRGTTWGITGWALPTLDEE